jgi:hypothetical protein
MGDSLCADSVRDDHRGHFLEGLTMNSLTERIALYRSKKKPDQYEMTAFDIYIDGIHYGWARRVDAPKQWSVYLDWPGLISMPGHGNTFAYALKAAILGLINDLNQSADRMRIIAEDLAGETIPDPEE